MQLVAYGAQDVYLTGNPQITFWKVTYRRYTNFACEAIEQTFNGQADFGRRVTCTISRNGDLAYRTYLQATLPEINQAMANPGLVNTVSGGDYVSQKNAVYARWLDFPGEQMISQVEVEIGGQRIDRQYGDWMHIWNQLTLTSEQQNGYYQMVGQTTQLTYITDPLFAHIDGPCSDGGPRQVCAPRNALPETTLYVPLQFWYCRNPGLALPLIALQYHEVKINLDIRPIDECLWAFSSLGLGNTPLGFANPFATGNGEGLTMPSSNCSKVTTAYAQSLVAASLYVDYVFLDTDERRRMAQNPHEYLIEQLQFTGDESVGSSSNKIKLNFNHPVKELIWVVQPDQNVDYCASLECGTLLNGLLGAQPFNYTDAVDALPNAIHAYGSMQSVGGTSATDPFFNAVRVGEGGGAVIQPNGQFQQAGAVNAPSGGNLGFTNNPLAGLGDGIPFAGNTQQQDPDNNIVENVVQGVLGGASGEGTVEGANVVPGLIGSAPDLPPIVPGSQGGAALLLGQNPGWTPNAFANANLGRPFPTAGGRSQSLAGAVTGVSDAGTFVLAETALTMHCWGENPVVTAKLQLNGQDRFSEREGTYFDLVQPYQHHTRNPDTGINIYSFSLRPEEHQPSGTCNFSRIDNATLQMVLSNATVEGTKTAKVRVYATNYNVLRIMSGMGGLAYSN